MTLKKIIEKVKKLGLWDLASYNLKWNNCKNFIGGVKVINPKIIHISFIFQIIIKSMSMIKTNDFQN